jgi:hypothetical protein
MVYTRHKYDYHMPNYNLVTCQRGVYHESYTSLLSNVKVLQHYIRVLNQY